MVVWVRRAVGPEVAGRAAVALVEVQGVAGGCDQVADVAAMWGGEGGGVEGGVVVEGGEIVVNVASCEGGACYRCCCCRRHRR